MFRNVPTILFLFENQAGKGDMSPHSEFVNLGKKGFLGVEENVYIMRCGVVMTYHDINRDETSRFGYCFCDVVT